MLLSAALVAIGFAWWAIGTEPGSRWLVGKAIEYAELDIELEGVSGTLWYGLRAERFVYEDADRRVELVRIEVEADWSQTDTAQISIARLAAERLAMESLSEGGSNPEPLDLDLPPLPLRVQVESVWLQEAVVDDAMISVIAVDGIAAEDLDIGLTQARATFGEYQVRLADLGARLAGDVPLNVDVSWQAADGSWSGEGSIGGSLHQVDVEHELFGEFPLRTQGSIVLVNLAEPSFDLYSSFEDWRYEEWTATTGRVHLAGTVADYRAELTVSGTDSNLLAADFNGQLRGNDSGFSSIDLVLNTFDGEARVSGNAAWSPAMQAELIVTGSGLDFSLLTGGFTTRLDMELDLVATDVDRFSINVRSLTGWYNEQPVRVTGAVSRDGDEWRCEACDATVGENRLRAGVMANNRRISGTIDVDAPALDQLYPTLGGMLEARGALSGSPRLPVLSGSVTANDLIANDMALGSGYIEVTGDLEDIDVKARWTFEGISIECFAQMRRDDDGINGRILNAGIAQKETGIWTLAEAVGFAVTPELLTVDESLWSNEDARLRIGQLVRSNKSLVAEAELTGAPLGWLDPHTPQEVAFDGYVDAFLRLQQDNGYWTGRVDWRQRETMLHVELLDGDVFDVAVPTAIVQARLAPTGATLRARLEADGGVVVDFEGVANELSGDADIDARLVASGQEFGWIAAFIPEIDEVSGSATADFRVTGRADDPRLRGELQVTDGRVVLPAFNVPVTDIQVRLTATSSDSLDVVGEALSGGGSLAITGSIRDAVSVEPKLEILVRGDEATALDWPDYVLVASPDLSLSGEGNEYVIDGRVRLDRAEILVRELPEGAVSPSSDVTVEGREEADRRASRLSGSLEIELSEQVHVRAFGLDTNLVGELRIVLPPGREPRANGELSLAGGFFEMYGQRLEVERGTLLFSGPLDNPFVDVRVVREIDGADSDITVGVDITGRANALVSTLYSDPAMPESEILSYLVTGRPLGQASTVDGALISDAAFSLGLRQAAVITNQVGQAIGLDELVLEGSSQDSAALVAGKQVTSNLYARYRYGVFSSLGELLLRYSLSESVSIEVGAGEFQSVDIQYTIERD